MRTICMTDFKFVRLVKLKMYIICVTDFKFVWLVKLKMYIYIYIYICVTDFKFVRLVKLKTSPLHNGTTDNDTINS